MDRYYAELDSPYGRTRVLRPTVINAASEVDGLRLIPQRFPGARLLTKHIFPLSRQIGPQFRRVEEWGEGPHYLPIGIFREGVQALMEEGKRLAEFQLLHPEVPAPRFQPQMGTIDPDDFHERLNLPIEVVSGAEFVVFPHRNEASFLMATIIREAMIRSLWEMRAENGN